MAGLRRGVVVLALVLTAVAGPLGRPSGEQTPRDEVPRPVAISSNATAPGH